MEILLYQKDPNYSLLFLDEISCGFVFLHKKADNIDLDLNLKISHVLAKNGYKVVIRAHQKKGKNPELLVNGELCDIKTPTKLHSINNGFSHAQEQGINIFVSDLQLNHSIENLISGISKGFKHNKYIHTVIFVKNNIVVEITRKMYESEEYIKYLNRLLTK